MIISIKNLSSEDEVIFQNLRRLAPDEVYEIPADEKTVWGNNDEVLTAITNAEVQILVSGNAISGIAQQINYLKDMPLDMDASGREVTKQATTDKGWAYLAHSIEMETSKDGAVFSEDYEGNIPGSFTIRFYDNTDTEIVDEGAYADKQAHIDNKCVKTTLTVDLDKDFDVISGMLEQHSLPKDENDDLVNIRMWVLIGIFDNNGIPFDPDGPGTAWENQVTEFVRGINLKFLADSQTLKTDGRSGKKLFKIVNEAIPYNQNQIQFIFKHPAGFQHEMMTILEYYRSV